MAQPTDVAVVGTGTAASGVASRCRAAGRSVAVVDDRPYGGTCALRGCDPKKVLRRAAEVVDAARLLHGKGVADPGLAVDWRALMAFKRTFTDPVPRAREAAFARQGIATYKGTARFVGESTLAVGEELIEFRKAVIASGARPAPLSFSGAEHVIDSDRFLDLEALPERLLFVGGGYVSFELAHIAARAGAEVIVLDRGQRPLTAFDADLVDRLVERTRALGATVRSQAEVCSVERTKGGFRTVAEIEGVEERFGSELVVHGAGRVPAVDTLDLDKANVKADRHGVEVNEYLQSTGNPLVYAAGDAAATHGPPLTPVASLEAKVVAANLLEGNGVTPDYRGVPSVVFTIPELVRVGLTEAEAGRQGLDFTCKLSDMRDWFTVRRVGESHAAAKVLLEHGSDRILGAHILGPEASEVVNLFALAIRTGLAADSVKTLVSAYPSAGSDIGYLL